MNIALIKWQNGGIYLAQVNPYGIHGTNADGINDYYIYSVLTILSKNKFALSWNWTPGHNMKNNA